jgi:hypothetical protein
MSMSDSVSIRAEQAADGPSQDHKQLSPEQIARWAELLAKGETEFPDGLRAAQKKQLEQDVRRLRCARLVQFIARCIADDIWLESTRLTGGERP